MPINKNHEFEELDGVKCGIVEKNVTAARVDFLRKLLEFNGFSIVVVASPPPKMAAAPVANVGEEGLPATPNPQPAAPETFTVAVTDYTFNSINAIFGRLLRTADGHVVTLAYWQQKEAVSNDEIPYYENINPVK
ncbi:MAG: hypothetical protein H7X88_09180 [Gloeobacteraceae cyanobacterium ES-bin-316]|nr:hypothetical protein [Ferruginibacter sp.]